VTTLCVRAVYVCVVSDNVQYSVQRHDNGHHRCGEVLIDL